MGQSLAQIIGGPALVTYRGATIRSKGDITLRQTVDTFPIETGILAQVDERQREAGITLSFVPDGEWSNLSVLYPYATVSFGDLITPVRAVGNVAGNIANVPNHQLLSGDAVYPRVYGGGTITVGLTAGTLYYVHAVSPDAVTFHTTRADGVAGTNVVAISNGTGNTSFVVNNPVTIQTVAGQLLTFFNCAVTKMPDIYASAVQTLMEEVTFECFLRDGADWSSSTARYSIVSNPWPGDSFTPSNILTQPVTASWGVAAPWDSFNTKTGFRISFAMTLDPYEVDSVGLISRRFSNLVVTARATPIGITEAQLAAAVYSQGTNAARGRSLSTYGNNLNLSASNFYARLYQAAIKGDAPQMFSLKVDRTGEVTWVATRTFSAGQPQPLFYVGSSTLT